MERYYKNSKSKLGLSETIGNSKLGSSASFNKLSQSNKLKTRDTKISNGIFQGEC